MLISDHEFDLKYGDIYTKKTNEAKYFIDHPTKLKEKCLLEQNKDSNLLSKPSVDLFEHNMTYYKGFIEYPLRLKNHIISREQEYSSVRDYWPTIMDLEPTSTCNFKCTMCQVSNWKSGKRADNMPFEEFKDFIDTNNHFTEVKLHGMGEPLLHKQYFEMVEYLSSQHIWTRTSTNGSLLHKKDNYKRLIDAEIGEVQCSFDGATKEVYESIRGKSNFETVVNNFTQLNKYANTKSRLYTRMWALIQKTNRHQLFDFVYLAVKMNFKRLSFSVSLNDWGRKEWNQNNKEHESSSLTEREHNKLIMLSKKYDIDITLWEQSNSYSTLSNKKLCPWVFNRPYISSDSKVVPCCMIADPAVINFGSSKKFKDIWNNKKYQAFRVLHLSGEIPQCCKICYK